MKQTLNMRQQLSINLRYCYSSRLSHTNYSMSVTRSSPTIGLNQRALPLYQQSLSHYITCQDVCVQ